MKDRIKYKTLFTGQHVDLVKKTADYVLTIDTGETPLKPLSLLENKGVMGGNPFKTPFFVGK
jgi:hypothetical protein